MKENTINICLCGLFSVGMSYTLAYIAGRMLGESKRWTNEQQSCEGNGEKAIFLWLAPAAHGFYIHAENTASYAVEPS